MASQQHVGVQSNKARTRKHRLGERGGTMITANNCPLTINTDGVQVFHTEPMGQCSFSGFP